MRTMDLEPKSYRYKNAGQFDTERANAFTELAKRYRAKGDINMAIRAENKALERFEMASKARDAEAARFEKARANG